MSGGHPNGLRRITTGTLREIRDRIVRRVNPLKVILFGSHAYGSPGEDSDLDILVVLHSRKRQMEREVDLYRHCKPKFVPVEFVALTPREIRRRLSNFDPFLEEILAKGRVLYERRA